MHKVDHSKNIIEVQNVSFAYDEGEVLRDVSLTIHKGDYLGLVGPNGAGKTTLLKIMLGLLTPTSGSVKLFEKEICCFKNWPKVGYVPQKAIAFDANFPATVFEVVLMGRYGKRGLFNRIKDEDRAAATRALVQVDMLEHRDCLIGDLSGGQQQRVFIARALVTEPEVIFLDEPTAGVDERSQTEFYALLQKLNKDSALTLVLVTHDIDAITHEAMHIACINRTIEYHGIASEYHRQNHNFHHHV